MTPDVARRFLHCLQVKNSEVSGGWVTSSCPLAPWTHKKGHDNNPSFGLRLDSATFNCFSCGASGSLNKLVSMVLSFLPEETTKGHGYDFGTVYKILGGLELTKGKLPEFEEFEEKQAFVEWPEWLLDQWPRVVHSKEATGYLLQRNVPPVLWGELEYRWDAGRGMIVCPYRTAFGKLAGARGRCVYAEAPRGKRHYDYRYEGRSNAKLVWYNEQALQNDGPIIVVEGEFDAARLLQVTPHVVANLTAKVSSRKLDKLTAKDSIIFMMDNDPTGRMAVHGNTVYPGALRLLEGKVAHLGVFEYPEEFNDPDQLSLDFLRKSLEGLVPLRIDKT